MVRHAAAHKHLNKKKPKGPFDYLVYFFMIATPLFELPQAISIYQNQSAESVSVYTWGFFFIASIVWAIYAARNKLYPLVVTYCMYIFTEGIILVGILLYG
ncbi:MAG TPA: PQ-loop domain-containing transporter [Patescibacteria group bacterium]|nr:PQ-loop domain-containing transporter [Patescibacteria group bacterium]